MATRSERVTPVDKQGRYFSIVPATNTGTYTSTAISTGVTTDGGFGIRITDVEIGGPTGQTSPIVLSTTGDFSLKAQVTRDAQTAMLGFSDTRVLAYYNLNMSSIVTTSGSEIMQTEWPQEMWLGGETLVVSPTIYFGLTSTGQGTVNVEVRMYYEMVKLSEIDILRILQG